MAVGRRTGRVGPYRNYYNALVGELSAPEVLVDAFHIVRLGNHSWTGSAAASSRKRSGIAATSTTRCYSIRRLLLTDYERLTDRSRQRLQAGLAAGDPDDEVWYAHIVKEQLRTVYRADDEAAAGVELADLYDVARAADIPSAPGWPRSSWPTTPATG